MSDKLNFFSIINFINGFLVIILSSDHNQDIGIECYGLLVLELWKGIEFNISSKPSSLQFLHVYKAYEAVKGDSSLPDLDHVTIERSAYGVLSENGSCQLTISDSVIRDNFFAGIQFQGTPKNITIKNTIVRNTTHGHGLLYRGLLPEPMDFCSVDSSNITSFPIVLEALARHGTTVDCAKVRSDSLGD